MHNPHIEDVTIIGAGFSGLALADALTNDTHGPSKVISVREASHRIGGRMYTVEIPNTGGLKAELGAMRFNYSDTALLALIKTLGLTTIETNDMAKQLFHYVRGKRIELTDYEQHPEKIPYHLKPEEKGKHPDRLFLETMETIVPGINHVTSSEDLDKLLDSSAFEGKPLHEWDLGEIMRRKFSDEAFAMIQDTHGFVDGYNNHNAREKIKYYFSGHAPSSFYQLTGGMISLINALQQRITQRGVTIHTNHTLTAATFLDPHAIEQIFVLSFAGKSDVHTRHLMMTIAPLAMLNLNRQSVFFKDSHTTQMMETAKRTVSATKIYLVYDKPWWEALGLKEGRIHTDQKSRQIFLLKSTDKGAVICIYKDEKLNWDVHHEDPHALYQNRDIVPEATHIPAYIVHRITDELKSILKCEVPAPRTALYKAWNDATRGAFFQWNPGIKANEVAEHLCRPVKNVYFTGDNFGPVTGWAASALESVTQTADEVKKQQGPKARL